MSLSYKEISEILKIIDSSDCQEFVLEVGDTKLVVQRDGAVSHAAAQPQAPAPAAPAAAAPQPAAAQPAPAPEPATPAPATPAAPIAGSATGTEVRAPMVGTFYRKPSPTEPPFVEQGQAVKKGDPLCLIEVMKLYTTIESPADGVVAAIGANDSDLVAHNQVLFVIEPA